MVGRLISSDDQPDGRQSAGIQYTGRQAGRSRQRNYDLCVLFDLMIIYLCDAIKQ